jgi:hypothetical protein
VADKSLQRQISYKVGKATLLGTLCNCPFHNDFRMDSFVFHNGFHCEKGVLDDKKESGSKKRTKNFASAFLEIKNGT